MTNNNEILQKAANEARGLAIDAINACSSGHLGLPLGCAEIGAVLFGEKTADVLTPGTHGSTFGGNPVVCAGALTILKRLDDDFLDKVKEKGEYMFKAFTGAKGIRSVSGMGMMVGLETEKPASEVVGKCLEKGVLCLTAKNKVRLLPALTIPMKDLEKAVDIIKNVCAEDEA